MAVTSYGRNKNHDEIKKTKKRPIIAPAIAVRLLKKFVKISIKLRVFSDWLFVSSHGRRGWGGGVGVHRGSDGEGGVQQWGGGGKQRRGGAIGGGGVNSGGVVNL